MKRNDATPELEAGASQLGNLLQFLAWIAERPRTYAQTMDAWRIPVRACPPGKTRPPTDSWTCPGTGTMRAPNRSSS